MSTLTEYLPKILQTFWISFFRTEHNHHYPDTIISRTYRNTGIRQRIITRHLQVGHLLIDFTNLYVCILQFPAYLTSPCLRIIIGLVQGGRFSSSFFPVCTNLYLSSTPGTSIYPYAGGRYGMGCRHQIWYGVLPQRGRSPE